MRSALSSFRWGLLLILIDFNLGSWDILPDFVGYFLFLEGLREMEEECPDIMRLAPFCKILAWVNLAAWFLKPDIPLLSLFMTLLNIYVVYTILSEAAEYGIRQSYEEGKKLKRWKDILAVFQVVMFSVVNYAADGEAWVWVLGITYWIVSFRIIGLLIYMIENEDKKTAPGDV